MMDSWERTLWCYENNEENKTMVSIGRDVQASS